MAAPARLMNRNNTLGLGFLIAANVVSLMLAAGIDTANLLAMMAVTLARAVSVHAPPQLVWLGMDL